MARVTLATVAEALGVSTMTVSNAYNRPEKLSAELRERILAKADELGYPGPDAVARSLRRGRSAWISAAACGMSSPPHKTRSPIECATG